MELGRDLICCLRHLYVSICPVSIYGKWVEESVPADIFFKVKRWNCLQWKIISFVILYERVSAWLAMSFCRLHNEEAAEFAVTSRIVTYQKNYCNFYLLNIILDNLLLIYINNSGNWKNFCKLMRKYKMSSGYFVKRTQFSHGWFTAGQASSSTSCLNSPYKTT